MMAAEGRVLGRMNRELGTDFDVLAKSDDVVNGVVDPKSQKLRSGTEEYFLIVPVAIHRAGRGRLQFGSVSGKTTSTTRHREVLARINCKDKQQDD